MAVFRYKMQGILDIKEKLEDKAKQEFAEANMRLEAEKQKLSELQKRRDYYMMEGVKLRMELIDVRKIRENKMAVLQMDEFIREQRKEVNKAAAAVEKARAALQEVMQERKAHEKLKENAFQDFLKEEQAAESRAIDELTTYTHGQKLQGQKLMEEFRHGT
ncbi:MAG: flagellar export protein FliJ [Lachnospiraceae bacterium]|jgi:flagellar FliJ protein|nr:flagellar export protein FliJ [Lachnospiraceae bacterium]MCX4376384.1 flagellar export protein FliJ [Lachnospiraceae bacterium]